MKTRVALVGCCGRMGRAVRELAAETGDIELAAGVEVPGHPELGTSCGSGMVTDSLAVALKRADVAVDFALAEGAAGRIRETAAAGRAWVGGVTGLDDAALAELERAAGLVPTVLAANFSLGVGVLCELAGRARELLGPEFDVEVVETHHRLKQDAPSGTASELVRRLAGDSVCHGREGRVGVKPRGEVGVHAVRTGDVVGDHLVVFGGPGERLELVHRATSRSAFAAGALAAARFAHGRAPGRYSMADVIAAFRA